MENKVRENSLLAFIEGSLALVYESLAVYGRFYDHPDFRLQVQDDLISIFSNYTEDRDEETALGAIEKTMVKINIAVENQLKPRSGYLPLAPDYLSYKWEFLELLRRFGGASKENERKLALGC